MPVVFAGSDSQAAFYEDDARHYNNSSTTIDTTLAPLHAPTGVVDAAASRCLYCLFVDYSALPVQRVSDTREGATKKTLTRR